MRLKKLRPLFLHILNIKVASLRIRPLSLKFSGFFDKEDVAQIFKKINTWQTYLLIYTTFNIKYQQLNTKKWGQNDFVFAHFK